MKTQTTSKAIWLRCLILLPLLAITLYGFSDEKIVEKEEVKPHVLETEHVIEHKIQEPHANVPVINNDLNATKHKPKSEDIKIYVDKVGQLFLNHKMISMAKLNQTLDEINNETSDKIKHINLHFESGAPKEIITDVNALLNKRRLSKKKKEEANTPTKELKKESENSDLKDLVKVYNKKLQTYKKLLAAKPHYINKSKKAQKELDNLFSYLHGMCYVLSKVECPKSPFYPYVKLEKNGEIYFKAFEDFTTADQAFLAQPKPFPKEVQEALNHKNEKEKARRRENAKIQEKARQLRAEKRGLK